MVPSCLSVRLHKVGYPPGGAHRLKRLGRPGGALTFRGRQQGPLDSGGVQTVYSDVAKQPLEYDFEADNTLGRCGVRLQPP